jgi:hypothetical protein
MADRTGDAAWIAVVIEDLLAANPDTTLPEIDYEPRRPIWSPYPALRRGSRSCSVSLRFVVGLQQPA